MSVYKIITNKDGEKDVVTLFGNRQVTEGEKIAVFAALYEQDQQDALKKEGQECLL